MLGLKWSRMDTRSRECNTYQQFCLLSEKESILKGKKLFPLKLGVQEHQNEIIKVVSFMINGGDSGIHLYTNLEILARIVFGLFKSCGPKYDEAIFFALFRVCRIELR